MTSKTIAYTLGEPAGIGADIIIQYAQHNVMQDIVCVGDLELLNKRAKQLRLPLEIVSEDTVVRDKAQLRAINVPVQNISELPSIHNVDGVLNMLDTTIDGCISGKFAAMVTGPLHKGIINQAGKAFSGHTEYLAERTNAPLPVMLLASSKMRVALVTTHLPLKDVPRAINKDLIQQICRIIDQDLRIKYGIDRPRQLICGLNPHAGEGGHLGMEEIEVIQPALEELRNEGLDVVGPLPADTLFTTKNLAKADVAVAMYHDQGLPVLKSQSFGEAANITLGLPIIRTSVDHGTAFDLVGSGDADIGSLQTAIAVAREMVVASNE